MRLVGCKHTPAASVLQMNVSAPSCQGPLGGHVGIPFTLYKKAPV